MAYSVQQGHQTETANTVLAGPTTGAAAKPTYRAVIEADLSLTNIATNDVSITKHGFAPTLPNDATKYLDGTGAYTVPAGSGSGGVNAKTINYTALSGDNGKLITFNGSNLTLLLPASPPSSTWFIAVENSNATNLTVSPNGLNIDGGSGSVTVPQNAGLLIYTDGSNYFTMRGMATGGGSGITLQVNGTPNASQTVLNLKNGTHITITDLGAGDVQFVGDGNATQLQAVNVISTTPTNRQVLTYDSITTKWTPVTNPDDVITYKRQTKIVPDGTTTTFTVLGDVVTTSFVGGGVGVDTPSTAFPPNVGGNAGNAVVGSWSGNLNYQFGKNLEFYFAGDLARTTNERIWFSMTDQTAATMGGSDNPAGNYMGFRYSTGAGDTNWQCITKDNSTQTVTDSGVAVTTDGFQFAIKYSTVGPTVYFYINGTLVATHTTHLPTSTALGRFALTTTTSVNNTGSGVRFYQVFILSDLY